MNCWKYNLNINIKNIIIGIMNILQQCKKTEIVIGSTILMYLKSKKLPIHSLFVWCPWLVFSYWEIGKSIMTLCIEIFNACLEIKTQNWPFATPCVCVKCADVQIFTNPTFSSKSYPSWNNLFCPRWGLPLPTIMPPCILQW